MLDKTILLARLLQPTLCSALISTSVAGCDGDVDDSESATSSGDLGSTSSTGSTGTDSGGDSPLWSAGPDCPEHPSYQCSIPPMESRLDADGCLLSPCSPDSEQPGCPAGEECLPTEECMPLVGGCTQESGECACEADPTCFDFACQLPES